MLLALTTAPTLAQTGSLTLTNLLCPLEYGGTNHASDCTEPPAPPLGFQLDGPTPTDGTADRDGVVTFTGLMPGTYTATGGVPGEFADLVVTCARANADWPVEQDGAIVTIEIPADAEIACFWWNIPLDLSGKPPSGAMPAPDGAEPTVIGLALLAMAAAIAGWRLARCRVVR